MLNHSDIWSIKLLGWPSNGKIVRFVFLVENHQLDLIRMSNECNRYEPRATLSIVPCPQHLLHFPHFPCNQRQFLSHMVGEFIAHYHCCDVYS